MNGAPKRRVCNAKNKIVSNREIASLKAEIASLQARVAELEPAPKPEPAPLRYQEREVSITCVIERGAFVMPDEAQSRRLLAIVQARYFALKLRGDATDRDRETELRRFRAAFYHIGHMDRMVEELNAKAYPSWWSEGSEIWLQQFGGKFTSDLTTKTWLSALVAHGDVRFSTRDGFNTHYDFGVGLIALGTGGRKCTNAWKKLLDGSLRVRGPVSG